MRRIGRSNTLGSLAALLLLWTGDSACGQTARSDNAARTYQQAMDQLQRLRDSQSPDLMLLMDYSGDPNVPVTPEIRAALARMQPILEVVRQAAAKPHCEFDINREDGIGMLLPHLSHMRGFARLMKADVMVRLNDGDSAAASSLIGDMYRISGHFSTDDTVISSLVGQAIFGLTDGTAQYATDRGMLSADDASRLLEGIDRLNATDPFDYAGSVLGEKEMFGGWISRRIEEEENPGKVLSELMGMGIGDVGMKGAPFLLNSKEWFENEIGIYNSMMDRMVAAFRNPDRQAALLEIKEIESEIESVHQTSMINGEGLLVGMLMPALGKAMEQRNKAEKTLADRRAMLQGLASGRLNPEDVANAGIWYMRAVELAEKLDPALLESVRKFAGDTSGPMSDELAQALVGSSCAAIIDLVREGSKKGRCDFMFAREEWGKSEAWRVTGVTIGGLLVPYGPGLHDVFRILHADAVRLLRRGDEGSAIHAVDRLAICFRMSAHLSSDPIPLTNLIAHCNFNRTADLVRTAIANQMIDDAFKTALLAAVERMDRQDPFGFIRTVIDTRAQLGKYLGRFAAQKAFDQGVKDFEAERQRLGERMKAFDGDQLLYLLAVLETTSHNATRAAVEKVRAEKPELNLEEVPSKDAGYARVGDVLSLPDLHAVQREIPQIALQLSQQDFSFLTERPIPAIAASKLGNAGGNFVQHMRRARADVASALALLRANAEPNPARTPQ